MSEDGPALPDALIEALGEVRSVGVITGAGVSAESGVPTYRGVGGLYDDPERGDETVEALTGTTLDSDPDRTWAAVADLARASAEARPHAAHHALAAIEDVVERFTLLTQNVDGLHQEAGSRNVIAIHGDVFAVRCMSCSYQGRLERRELPDLCAAPSCPTCGGVLRPDAVLFGEELPREKLRQLVEAFEIVPPDLVMAVGTTAMFPYIAGPVLTAVRAGRLTIEVNPEPTLLTSAVSYALGGRAGSWLPQIARALGAPD